MSQPPPKLRVRRARLTDALKIRNLHVASVVADASLNAVPFYRAHGYIRVRRIMLTRRDGGALPAVRMRKRRLGAATGTL